MINGGFASFGEGKTSTMLKSLIIIRGEAMAKKLSPITPGDVLLEEFLKPMEISQNQLARDIKVPANRISQIIHGKREITADTALRLGKYFGIEPEFWLNLQVRYNMKVARSNFGRQIEKEVKVHLRQANGHHLVPA
ncbi:MAG: HigA family addiction module antitoxin [Desulfobulbaceae bacterium]|nr:HigA family addiction module antitoxin [Desulfobulbaceae bacterium]